MTEPNEPTIEPGFMAELAALGVGDNQIDSPELDAMRERARVNKKNLPPETELKRLVQLHQLFNDHPDEKFSQTDLALAIGMNSTSQGYVSTLLRKYAIYFHREDGLITTRPLPEIYLDEYARIMEGKPSTHYRDPMDGRRIQHWETIEALLKEILAELRKRPAATQTSSSPVESNTAKPPRTTTVAKQRKSEDSQVASTLNVRSAREYMEPSIFNTCMAMIPEWKSPQWTGNLANIKNWDKDSWIKVIYKCMALLDSSTEKYIDAMQFIDKTLRDVEKLPADVSMWPFIAPSVITLMSDKNNISVGVFDGLLEKTTGQFLYMFILRATQLIYWHDMEQTALDYITTFLMATMD